VPNPSPRARRALLLAGCSSLVLFPSAAFAQTTPDPQDPNAQQTQPPPTNEPGAPDTSSKKEDQGAIVITGIRRGVADAIAIKRKERGVVEAVSAEEIGKLPDVSIAESIARLPGIAAQRVGGRAEIVSIRGFSPDFSTVLLNGRQQASSGYNRAVEFDQYPSELLGSVVVYKTPDAGIVGMGLAGTVDLRTIRPLEYGKRAIALNIRGQLDEGGGRNKDQSKWGWRGSASYIGQNEDGTLGWMIGYAHLDAPGHIDHTSNWFWDNYACGGCEEFSPVQPQPAPYILSGQEVMESTSRDLRDGITGTLEFKPSDAVHSVLDLYYSRFKQHTIRRGAMWFSDAWVDNVTYSNLQVKNIGGTDFAVSGHVNNVVPILRFDDNSRTDHLFAAGLNNDFKVAERTHILADLSYSQNKRDETYIETYGGYGCCVAPIHNPDGTWTVTDAGRAFDSYDFKISQDDFPKFSGFGLNYADANQVSLGDRAPWGGWGHDGLKKSPHIKETLYSGDLTVRQDFDGTGIGSFFSSVEAGLDYTHRHKDKTVDELDLFLKNGRQQVLVDPKFLTDPTDLGYAGFGDVLGVEIDKALPTYYDEVATIDANHYDKSWDIKENILTLKAKANIDSGDLHGNVGIQVVQQKQTSSGLRIYFPGGDLPIQLQQTTDGAKYTDILPSLNLFYDFDNHNRIRFAAAKVMQRPRMDDLRANMVPFFNGQACEHAEPPCGPGVVVHPWSAGGGNPKLKPWTAKEVDVGYEWYGGKASYFALHGFYYWLDTWIYTQALQADFSSLTPPPDQLAILEQTGATISNIGELDAPANGQGGWIRGVEASGALELNRLTRVLDGFGVQGSVSYTDYYLPKQALSDYNQVLPGFSKWVYDITGYYEKNGFQARAAYRHRSAFRGEVVSLFTNLGYPLIQPDSQLDAQVGYTFQPGSRLNGLGILLQVSNVLNSPYRTYYTVGPNQVQTLETVEKYGRQWLLGASYHF
jgi:iron complex outermembrane receptor protein